MSRFGITPYVAGGRALYVPRSGPAYETGPNTGRPPQVAAPQQQSPFAGGQVIGEPVPPPDVAPAAAPAAHSPNFLASVEKNTATDAVSGGTFAAGKSAGLSDADARRQAYIARQGVRAGVAENQLIPPPPTILMGGRGGATVLPPGVASPAYMAGGGGAQPIQRAKPTNPVDRSTIYKNYIGNPLAPSTQPSDALKWADQDLGLRPREGDPTTQPSQQQQPIPAPQETYYGKDHIKITPEIAQSMYQVQHDQAAPGQSDETTRAKLGSKLGNEYGLTNGRTNEINSGLQPPTNPPVQAAPTEVLLHRQPVESPIWQPFVQTPTGTGVHIGAGLYQFPDGRVVPTDQAGKTLGPAMQGQRPPNLGVRYQLPTRPTIAPGSQGPAAAHPNSGFEGELANTPVPPPSMSPLAQAAPAAQPASRPAPTVQPAQQPQGESYSTRTQMLSVPANQPNAIPRVVSESGDGNNLPTPRTPEEAAALPPGTRFKTPDGRVKVR